MRTAVDSSVLLDVLGADPRFGVASREALRAAYRQGALVACDVVWAEVSSAADDRDGLRDALGVLGIQFDPLSQEAAELAGRLWRAHRTQRSRPRERVIADFLIGAHARLHADQLLTRDRGFYRGSFEKLLVVDPSQTPA